MSFVDAVNALSSQDNELRNNAEKFLKQQEQNNFGEYLYNIGAILENTAIPAETKTMAGIIFKRACKIPESVTERKKLIEKYTQLAIQIREGLKTVLINILKIEDISVLQNSPFMALASLAILDININSWQTAFTDLTNIVQNDPSLSVRCHFLSVICFICEEIDEDFLTQQALSSILTCIFANINDQTTLEFKRMSLNTLVSIIHLCDHILVQIDYCNLIVSFLCKCTQENDEQVVVKSYECLINFVSGYYLLLGAYISVLEDITLKEMSNANQEPEIRFPAIEFWCTLTETEGSYSDDQRSYAKYIDNAVDNKSLLQILFTIMQEETSNVPQKDMWNPKAAATVCMELIANLIPDKCCTIMINTVLQGISHEDYKIRDASLLTLGTLVEYDQLSEQIIITSLDFAIRTLQDDQVLLVKDTAAWLFCQLLENQFHYIQPKNYEIIINLLVNSLRIESSISIHCSSALYKFSESVGALQTGVPQHNALSIYFQTVIPPLFQIAIVQEANLSNLRESCFEAINSWIKNTGESSNAFIMELYHKVRELLKQALTAGISMHTSDLIARYTSCIHTVIMRFSKPQFTYIINNQEELMGMFLMILDNESLSVAHQDTFLAIGSLSGILKSDFKQYVQRLNPYIVKFLSQSESDNLIIDAICLISDLSSALEDDILLFSDLYMGYLLNLLSDDDISQTIKPLLFTTIGDIAFAIKKEFQVYIDQLKTIFMGAVTADIEDDDDATELYQSMIECSVGIVNGLTPEQYSPLWDSIMMMLTKIAKPDAQSSILKQACGLIGDLVRENPSNKTKIMDKLKDIVECIISYARKNNESKENADYAYSMIFSK